MGSILHEGEPVGKHRVARIMRENGWRAKAAKKFKATTNSKHQLPVAPNLLNQNFFAHKPNEKWVSDITYCWTEEGWSILLLLWIYIHAKSLDEQYLSV